MFDWKTNLTDDLAGTPWAPVVPAVLERCTQALQYGRHGDLPQWLQALESLPATETGWQIEDGAVVAGSPPFASEGGAGGMRAQRVSALNNLLTSLIPWRKGPFRLGGVFIDTEWRSDWKWDRVKTHIDLSGQTVLDVGAGNGYFGWRMLEAGARRVIACDPTLIYVMQHLAICHFAGPAPNHLLPLRLEDLPKGLAGFDTIFSMGVLYHRRNHLAHLQGLKERLKSGGRLVLETLILPGDDQTVLHPPDRYANMRNVHAIPTLPVLFEWLEQAGFSEARCVDQTYTTTEEQHATEWMPFHSLKQALSEGGRTTIEGHPPPLRAMLLAGHDL